MVNAGKIGKYSIHGAYGHDTNLKNLKFVSQDLAQ